jgi:hypothetical protein
MKLKLKLIKYLFTTTKPWKGLSGVERHRKQVFFFFFFFVVSCLISFPPLGVPYLHRLPEYHQSPAKEQVRQEEEQGHQEEGLIALRKERSGFRR